MSISFVCALIGRGTHLVACADLLQTRSHRVVHVISDCPLASAWAERHGVARTDPSDDYVAALGREAFDYLFSIANHAVTPAAVLALPRAAAINCHDSLLPAYSGFHAPTWSILDGQAEHGVTWHRMTKDVDEGPYLLQKSFPVANKDTAFTLAARAGELGVRSFAELISSLEDSSAADSPGLPAQQFHRKSERPGLVHLDWTQLAEDILRVVRAFDFGDEDNWLSRAKLLTPSGEFLCVGSAVAEPTSDAAPGTLLRSTAEGITVQVAAGALTCSGLSTLEGDAIHQEQLVDYGLVAGSTLPSLPTALVEAASSLDREVTKSERFWVRRLKELSVPQLHELQAHAPSGPTDSLELALPIALLALSSDAQRAMLVAGLAVYATRIHDEVTTVDIPVCVATLSQELSQLYSCTVTLSFEIDSQTNWHTVVQDSGEELRTATARGSYARDVWTRYAALRDKSVADRQMLIAVAFDDCRSSLPAGVRLLLKMPPGAGDLELLFDTNAISALHAERIGVRILHLIQSGIEHSDASVGTLPIVPRTEQDLLLNAFQDTHRDNVDVACIHELFAAQVDRTPDKTALVCRDDSLTYRELHERSDALALHLRELGVGPDLLVGIAIERSLDMVIGLLAILKAGGAYVPLDPAYPTARLAMMLEDSGARWLLTQRHLKTQLSQHGATVVLVDEPVTTGQASALAARRPTPTNLAYVIFTSGSTGRPKGVMVEHRNVANFFAGMDERVGPEPGTWLAVTSISFDISVLEIFWTLCRGNETVVQELDALRSVASPASTATPQLTPISIREQFERREITHFQCTPSLAHILKTDGTLSSMKSLRKFLVGGEALSSDLAKTITSELPQVELVNMYGPTETTIWSTTAAIQRNSTDRITIGKPITNTQIRILDLQLQLLPLGTPGELCIGGDGVARGYLDRPELTAERFVADPFLPGNRIYRTGDLARFADDSTLEYLGRLDQQVKLNGHRIELGEIETVLQRHPAVKQAVVAVKDGPSQSQLVCYVLAAPSATEVGDAPTRETADWQSRWNTADTMRTGADVAPARFNTSDDRIDSNHLAKKLRDHLQKFLPDFMVPQAYVMLASLPLTPNGKIDRKALPDPIERAQGSNEAYVVPANDLERTIAGIWQDVLGVERVGRNDNIFDLGANSLQIAMFFTRVQGDSGVYLPLSRLFQAPTIRQLSEVMVAHGYVAPEPASDEDGANASALCNSATASTAATPDASATTAVVPPILIRPGTGATPIFFVHDGLGEVLLYRSLALLLDQDHPVYGLEPEQAQQRFLHTTIPDMAKAKVDRMRSVQPSGPYLLAGLCAGGVIAFEMARQLENSGESVVFVGMIDAPAGRAKERSLRVAKGRLERIRDLFRPAQGTPKVAHSLAALAKLAKKAMRWLVYSISARRKRRRNSRRVSELRTEIAGSYGDEAKLPFLQLYEVAHREHVANGVFRGGQVVLFRTTQGNGDPDDTPFREIYDDDLLGWQGHAQPAVEAIDVPGGHSSALQEPNVGALAKHMQHYIRSQLLRHAAEDSSPSGTVGERNQNDSATQNEEAHRQRPGSK